MGIIPCSLPCHSDKKSQSHSSHFYSDQSATSFSSQPSLASVPSLASQSSQPQEQLSLTHYQCISTLKGHSSYVSTLTLSGKYLFSGSFSKEIRVWNHEPLNSDPIHHSNVVAIGNGAIKSLVVLANTLFSAHQDNKIRVWQIENDMEQKYKKLATLPTLGDRVMKLLPSKNYVQVRRHKKCTWVHHVDAVSAMVLSRDGSLLYSASWDRTFKIWRTSDFRCLESVSNAHDDAINAIAVSDNGFVYTGSADNKIKVWNKAYGDKKHSLVGTLEKHRSGVNALSLSSDGSTLYSGACDRSIVVWEKDGGSGDDEAHMVVVGALRGHTMAVLCLAIVSDLICSGSADKTVRIWRKLGGRCYSCLAVLEGHNGPVKCLTAKEDYSSTSSGSSSSSSSTASYHVYSGSLDCDIKIWQISLPPLI